MTYLNMTDEIISEQMTLVWLGYCAKHDNHNKNRKGRNNKNKKGQRL